MDIVIRQNEDGLHVIYNGNTSGQLTLGETIEQILSIIALPARITSGNPCYSMRSEHEWKEWRRRYEEVA